MPSEPPELALIRRAQSGDTRAFEALVDEYQTVLYNLALRMSGNREDAWDLTQSVFLKVWRNLNGYDPAHRFYSWVYRIALNESLNFVQRRRQHEAIDEQAPDSSAGPDERVQQDELEDRIQEALMELTVEHRQVIVLRHFQELSYEEIAEMTGIPAKTVKSRLFSARQRLGEVLRRRGVNGS